MKKQIVTIAVGVIIGGAVLFGTYVLINLVVKTASQTNANTADIAKIVDFINKSVAANQPAKK